MKGMRDPYYPSSFEVGLILVILLAVTSAYCSSCATMEQSCRYEAGVLVEQETESMVVGTGETDFAAEGCTVVLYSTQDTGFSERVPLVIESVTKGAAKGAVEGFTGGLP